MHTFNYIPIFTIYNKILKLKNNTFSWRDYLTDDIHQNYKLKIYISKVSEKRQLLTKNLFHFN